MYNKHYLALKFSIFSVLLMVVATGCSHTEERAGDKPLIDYSLEQGQVIKAKAPLPDMIPIYVKWRSGKKELPKKLVFRGWDFDRDERIDMLEKLDDKGQVVETTFDFDFDGKIDWTQKPVD